MNFSLQTDDNRLVYAISFLFIALNGVLLYFEFFYLSLIPIGLGLLFLALLRLDTFYFLIILLTPVSIPIRKIVRGLENDLYLPTEPLIVLVLVIFIFKLLNENKFDKKIAYHPVSIAIYFHLIWMFFTSITSTMPLVSFKFLTSRIWFLVVFYFVATQVFRRYKNIYRYFWFYIIPFFGVIVYATVKHMGHGLSNQKAAHFVSQPFFNDHTAYGAALCMILPILFGMILLRSKSLVVRILSFFLFFTIIGAIVLSYTRAAWVSIAGALMVMLVMLFRIKFRNLLILAGIVLIVVISSWSQILMKLERNRSDSSDYLAEHAQSITNVSSDASNLERINRWSSAIRMFKEKPILGWGPGTYSFNYAPFQLSYQKTTISTNAGVKGNAHSEYLGPLSESGVLGSLSVLLIVALSLYTGIKIFNQSKNREVRILVMCLLFGLITYFIHGFLNNFLDSDKASAVVWGFIAILVSLDVYHQKLVMTEGEVEEK